MKKYLIGTDIGTQGTKTVLYDSDGSAICSAFEKSRLIYPEEGAVEQEPEEIFGSVVRTIKQVMSQSGVNKGDVVALGMDGQMAGFLGVDKNMNAVTPLDSWLDRRCEPYIDLMKKEAGDEITAVTGCPVTYAHGPKVLRWKNDYPEVYAKIDKFVEPVTYVVCRLCGLGSDSAYIDYTNIHFSGFADNRKLEWSDGLAGLFDVDIRKMPRIVNPADVIGGLTSEAAAQTGLEEGMPVVAGCGDQAATSLGAGVVREGDCFDGAGTASVFSCCTSFYSPDTEFRTVLYPHHILPGLYQPMAYISGGGLCLKWFKENALDNKLTYKELEAEADNIVPGNGGLYFIPHFNGRTCPNDPNVKGMFWGLNFTHNSAAMFKATMEAVAFEYKMYLDILKKNGAVVKADTLYGTGGGSVSPCFNRIKADVLGMKYKVTTRNDTATFGSALLAGYGVGLYTDLAATADAMTHISGTFDPDFGKHAEYAKYAAEYRKLLDVCGMLSERIKG